MVAATMSRVVLLRSTLPDIWVSRSDTMEARLPEEAWRKIDVKFTNQRPENWTVQYKPIP